MDINSEVSCGKGKAQTTAIYAKVGYLMNKFGGLKSPDQNYSRANPLL